MFPGVSFEIEAPPAKAWWCLNCFPHLCSFEIEVPPAKAWWCPNCFPYLVVVKLKYHRLKRGGVRHDKTHAYRTLACNPKNAPKSTPIRMFRHAKRASKSVQLKEEFVNLSTCI